MKAKNSYTFIPKEEKVDVKNETIRLKKRLPHLFEEYFKIDLNKIIENTLISNSKEYTNDFLDRFNKIINGEFKYKISEIEYNVSFKISEADGVYYLDIIIEGKKLDCILVLDLLNNALLNDKTFTTEYIPILTYDFVSESYCNNLYPLLNKYERKLRSLLFMIFTSQFKELYFEMTASESIQKKVKMNIKKKNEEYRIQNYFYSVDIGTLREFLFEKNWTSSEEEKRNEILEEDFSKVDSNTIKQQIKNLEPKSNWDRYFINKGFPDDIETIMKLINDLRNIIAHNKLMSKKDFIKLKELLTSGIKNVDKAIKITETVDFRIINRNKQNEIVNSFANSTRRMLGSITVNLNLNNTIKIMQGLLSDVSEKQKDIVDGFMKNMDY